MIIHPLRFARPTCLRGTVSYNCNNAMLMLTQDGTTQCDAIFILYTLQRGVLSVLSPQSVFCSPSYSPPVLYFRTDDEKKASLSS